MAVELVDPQVQAPDIWLIDTTRGITSRFTVDPALDVRPVWSPDGNRIVFGSPREGHPPNMYEKASSGATREEPLFRSNLIDHPTDWSRDGRFIVYARLDPKTQWDLWVVPVVPEQKGGERKPLPYLRTEFNEHNGQLSPDGRWMAYSSDESGRSEVYVRGFPELGARWQISTDGGVQPRWRGDGKELFYLSADGTLMAVAVPLETTFKASAPRALFKTRIAEFEYESEIARTNYVPAGDGQRFLINTIIEEAAPSPVTVVLNWAAALRR